MEKTCSNGSLKRLLNQGAGVCYLAGTGCITLTQEHSVPCEATQTQLIPASIQQQVGTELGNIWAT